jgi:hypothetical protein
MGYRFALFNYTSKIQAASLILIISISPQTLKENDTI